MTKEVVNKEAIPTKEDMEEINKNLLEIIRLLDEIKYYIRTRRY